jgi:hypothetical protein
MRPRLRGLAQIYPAVECSRWSVESVVQNRNPDGENECFPKWHGPSPGLVPIAVCFSPVTFADSRRFAGCSGDGCPRSGALASSQGRTSLELSVSERSSLDSSSWSALPNGSRYLKFRSTIGKNFHENLPLDASDGRKLSKWQPGRTPSFRARKERK